METVSVYCFICAKSREIAVNVVNGWLENRRDKEFYAYFTVQEGTGDTQLLSDLPDDYFTEIYTASQSLLRQFRENAEEMRKTGNRRGEARALRCASELLLENICPAMPWYNLESMDFFLPSDRQGWWAVMVDFYY
jgi:hypothetical protein